MEPAERIKQLENRIHELEAQIAAYRKETARIAGKVQQKPRQAARQLTPAERRLVKERVQQMKEAQRKQARPWMGDIETR